MTNQHFFRPVRFSFSEFFLVALFLPLVLSCGDGGGGTEPETVASITIVQDGFELPIRASTKLMVIVEDLEGNLLPGVTVNYSSSAPQVAEADSEGWVTAVGEGSATITAAVEGKVSSVGVTVTVLDFVSISAGFFHTCGLTTEGKIYCWGRNTDFQLGIGDGGKSGEHPHAVAGGFPYEAVAVGWAKSCGLTTSGAAYCWGWGNSAENVDETWMIPTAAPGSFSFDALTAASSHVCGIIAGGETYCWGRNSSGQLGNGNFSAHDTFVPVLGGFSFTEIRGGGSHTCGRVAGGTAYCWGKDSQGQLGHGFQGDRATPTLVSGGHHFKALATSLGSRSCGITVGGDALCWGSNTLGQIGGEPSDSWGVPAPVPGGLSFQSLTIGGSHGCGITTDAQGYCWGTNAKGQLGGGTRSSAPTPSLVSGGQTFLELTAGGHHTCGLNTSGSVYCWGDNREGQLGAGSGLQDSTTPVLIHGSR